MIRFLLGIAFLFSAAGLLNGTVSDFKFAIAHMLIGAFLTTWALVFPTKSLKKFLELKEGE